jgi:putative metallohydrolase (TIGR04338 family)
VGRTTRERIAEADPEALTIYALEDAAARTSGLRRYTTFAELVEHVERIVCSDWWDTTFPAAPIEVTVQRRSRTATFSAAGRDDVNESGTLWVVDSHGWNAETVLHELAHIAAPSGSMHGPSWRAALLELWRREAGFHAWVELRTAFATLN